MKVSVLPLLRSIIEGKTEFQPDSNSELDLEHFQLHVKLIKEAVSEGLFEFCVFRAVERSEMGHRYDWVKVAGLSEKGKNALRAMEFHLQAEPV